MERRSLGPLGPTSILTVGGGGIGQVWGDTSREEGIATLRAAVDAGIDLIDAAPGYKVCEALIGEAFEGKLPAGVRITTKCGIGTIPPETVYPRFRASLEKSLSDMRLERVDLFFLHNHTCFDDYVFATGNDRRHEIATSWSLYQSAVIPAFEQLVADGLIGAWGITGVAVPETIIAAVESSPRPAVIQSVTNLLDSPGGLTTVRPGRPRDIIAAAKANNVGIMGIRAVQAGALTAKFDRPVDPENLDHPDYDRAAPFRELCAKWGADPALIAHRYALGMAGVDTVVLGVKNRTELAQCVEAAELGPLSAEEVATIDALNLR